MALSLGGRRQSRRFLAPRLREMAGRSLSGVTARRRTPFAFDRSPVSRMKKLLQYGPQDLIGYPNQSPRTYCVRTTAGTFDVEDDGYRWTPGTPVPRDRQPDA